MDVRQLIQLSRELREVALRASQSGRDLPVSVGELAVIEHVARHQGDTITEISRQTGLAQSRISTVVGKLAADGVVVCSKDVTDLRQTLVALAPDIAEQILTDHGTRPVDDALIAVAPHLSPAEAARARALLGEVYELLNPER